jgi:hypothetical protein
LLADTRMRFVGSVSTLMLVALSACGSTTEDPMNEQCYVAPTSAVLTSDFAGTVPAKIRMRAAIEGGSCGCCGGKPQTKITSVRWFVDDIEQTKTYDPTAWVGPQTSVDVSIPVEITTDVRRVVEVEVADSDGATSRTPFVFFDSKE